MAIAKRTVPVRRLTSRKEDIKVSLLDQERFAWYHVAAVSRLNNRAVFTLDRFRQGVKVANQQPMAWQAIS